MQNISHKHKSIYLLHCSPQTYYKIDYILRHEGSLNRYKEIDTTPSILSEHHELMMDSIIKNRNGEKLANSWNLNNLMLNEQMDQTN